MKTSKGLLALSPLVLFMLIYLLSSIVAGDFYKVPALHFLFLLHHQGQHQGENRRILVRCGKQQYPSYDMDIRACRSLRRHG